MYGSNIKSDQMHVIYNNTTIRGTQHTTSYSHTAIVKLSNPMKIQYSCLLPILNSKLFEHQSRG